MQDETLEAVQQERDQLKQTVAERDAEIERLKRELDDPEGRVEEEAEKRAEEKALQAVSALGLSSEEKAASPKARVKVLDLSVDEALKLVLSCGVVFPEDSSGRNHGHSESEQ